MKTFPWLLTGAFAVVCVACWLTAGGVVEYVLHRTAGHLINAQSCLIGFRKCLLFLPLPFGVYSWLLSSRRELSLNAVLTFVGVIGIAGAFVLGSVAFLAVTSVTPSWGIILQHER